MAATRVGGDGVHVGVVGDRPPYPPIVRLLHWLTVLLIVAQFAVAWSIPENDHGESPLWNVHFSIGPIILIVALLRLLARVMVKTPPLPATVPPWQRLLARINQAALYAILVAQPITGWAIASLFGSAPKVAGIIQLPPLLEKPPEGVDVAPLAAPWESAHGVLATLLLVLVALHVAGALHHAFVRRDGVLRSMVSGRA